LHFRADPIFSCFMQRENSPIRKPLALRPSDVVVGLQLALQPGQPYAALATATGISLGAAHNAVQRLVAARLVSQETRAAVEPRLLEFLLGGVPYAFPAALGPETRGVPTAYGAPPLAARSSTASVPVWASATGTARGPAVTPLYPGAPALATSNRPLYELLALVDALRIGQARDRQRAGEALRQRVHVSAAS
jgi:hypothetical protein